MNLTYIETISWEDVFKIWSESESHLPRWIEHYKERGFDSWEAWRRDSMKDLHPETLTWKRYQITDLKEVLGFYGGPFRSWIQKYYGDNKIIPFKELVEKVELQRDHNIQEIIANFPKKSVLMALKKDDKIIIMDGMHRCSAAALASIQGKTLDTSLQIVMAEYNAELPLMGHADSPT